jgi:TRAP-type C4-dicarboxylate transport system substrate-binding protein
MRAGGAIALGLAIVAVAGCGGSSRGDAVVLHMASADPRGLEHQPAVADFVRRVGRLSGGRLRIVVDRRWSGGGLDDANEPALLRDVALGAADLGAAQTRSFRAVGVRSFDAFDVPGLVDGYRVEAAVLRSGLAARMLAGTRPAGLEGLALFAGPLSRPVGTRAPLLRARDYRGLAFGVRPSPVAEGGVRALGARPVELAQHTIFGLYLRVGRRPAPQTAYEDDLDALFFDRDDGARPWVTANVALWARPLALVANPRRLRSLSAQQRAWLERAAAGAARAPIRLDRDAALGPELCAAGVRIAVAPRSAIAALRRAWGQPAARTARRPALGAGIRRIAALRRRAGPDPPARVPPGCVRRPGPGAGVRSTLPEGIYRMRVTAADVRAADRFGNAAQTGTQTLTLRDGRWHLVITEPGRYEERGTYAGTRLRTTLISHRPVIDDRAYVSVVADRDGLRFAVGRAPNAFWPVVFASHRWRRIGD